MARLLLALVGLRGLAAQAGSEASDSFVLAQWSYRVSSAALEAGPSGSAPLALSEDQQQAVPTAAPADDFWDIVRLLPDALSEAMNATDMKAKSARPDSEGASGMQDMMKLLKALCESVRSDAFMGNITQLYKTLAAESKDYLHKSVGAVQKYSFWSRTAKDKEMPALTMWLLSNITNNSQIFRENSAKALDSVSAIIPPEMSKMLDNSNKKSEDEAESFASNASEAEACSLADKKLGEASIMLTAEQKGQKMLNGTQKMLPMLHDYLKQTKPDVAARLEFVLTRFIDSSYSIGSDMISFLETLLSETKPVLKARMNCHLSSGAPRLGLGLVALVAVLAAWLEL
eukprot:CAMPEP_0204596772 /NCGR_PEP_ID=MMETSP0661-20131031/53429_1 /ASSEMBLY_ACC=CAM_ASM_000606 /TAXON_ID=109239 /ORGANISM="Alexandrium margalefi, Strain AMGDE01CS-322" /LENGTH=343 /DNA_ID=CAMNT_0051607415 /DNA_START=63 /DNA_END=1094 /DNA_ORIENTATION=+